MFAFQRHEIDVQGMVAACHFYRWPGQLPGVVTGLSDVVIHAGASGDDRVA